MRFKLIKLILLLVLPGIVFAQGVEVKKSLKTMVDNVVDKAGIDNIKISPNGMTPTSLNIDQIDGVGLCDPAIRPKVEKLAKLFSKHRNIRTVISTYGVYVKKENGKVTFLPRTAEQVQHLVGNCKNLYVSVY